jgi:benzoyl-CoA reductase/2-hydroxyglutaryl-CoA dehydratase subunit BcrC/BadD/HgdB
MGTSFQPLNIIRMIKGKKTDLSEYGNFQLGQEIYDNLLKHFSDEMDKDPKAGLWKYHVVRAAGKLIRFLLFRVDNLLALHQRMGLELITAESMTPEVFAALNPGQVAFRKYVEGVIDCIENRTRPLVWIEWCLSQDLILAFDAQPMIPEAFVVLANPLGLEFNEKIIDIGEQNGVPVEYCSASRNAVGAYLARQLPDPACIVTVSHPCDSMVSSYQLLEYLTGAPTFRLDTPYYEDERSMDYYTEDIRRLIAFLEKHLDRKLDYDTLRGILAEVNKTNEYLMEINEMRRAKPCPGSIMPLIITWFFRELGLGTPYITEVARRLREITKKKFNEGKGAIKSEKIRVIWYDVPIAFYPVVMWMEEKFGAVIVMDVVSYITQPPIDTSTPESMIRGIAAENMNLAMARQFHGPVDFFHRDMHRVCEDYDGDCFIFAGHAGCKHGWASTRLLKEYCKKRNMPLLILTSDIFDQRLTNLDQIKAQIEEFFLSNGLA